MFLFSRMKKRCLEHYHRGFPCTTFKANAKSLQILRFDCGCLADFSEILKIKIGCLKSLELQQSIPVSDMAM